MDELVRDFITEAREGLEALDSQLVRFEQHPEDPELLGEIFRLVHTIKGTCGFLGLMRLQTVAHSAENVLGAFRDGELPVTPAAVTAILETVDLIGGLIEALANTGAEPEGDDSDLIGRLDALLSPPPAAEAPAAAAPAPASDRLKPLIERLGGDAVLDSACEVLAPSLASVPAFAAAPERSHTAVVAALCSAARAETGEGISTALSAAFSAPEAGDVLDRLATGLGPVLGELEVPADAAQALIQLVVRAGEAVRTQAPTRRVKAEPAAPPPPMAVAAAEAPGEGAPAAQTIRVSVDALEHLMTVVSELVLIRNQLIQTLRLQPESPFAAPLNRLNQVTSELQEGVMTTRMQPISGAWAKLPRLVRDLSQELGKKIELVTSGQETELDRQVLELIRDPLTHMIRNAADHGLETPEERRAANKPETGRIALSARHEGGAIVIEIADDGRGLSAAKIRKKALAQGLATAGQLETMSDADVRQFIFAPGFSTAQEVTAVSGRGVGMDVVRTNIEKIGGAIELSSVEGQGARFTIRIPLTLTIVSALIVECCGERFAMPQASVVELVSANDASGREIEYIDGAAVLRLRDRLLPLVSLETLLGLDPALSDKSETCIVVARVAGFSFGVIVDRVFDTEEIVVKPVSTVLRHLKLYSGATILGDGAVILILDFKGMAAECGGAHVNGGNMDEIAAAAVAAVDQPVALLVFRASNGALRAAPLSAISRIEEVRPGQIEAAGGRSVMQYRDTLMPLIDADTDYARDWGDSDTRPLLVLGGDDAVGLLVREIVDIVEVAIPSDLERGAPGTAGCLIVNGAATELIDVDHYLGVPKHPVQTRPSEAAPAAPAAAPAEPARRKRLLLIDASPFSQMLLRPMLSQAGYDVTVASAPDAALALHTAGEAFHLIMMDATLSGDAARSMAQALGQATRWHATPMLSLGFQSLSQGAAGQQQDLLGAVSESLEAA